MVEFRMSPARAATILAAIAWMVLGAVATIAPVAAQSYPNRPITIIVPFAAGGPTDVLARVLGERMRAALGQPVLIENVTGAGGSIGVGRVVSSPPDGYTISIGHFGTHVANGAIYPLKYDLLKDLDPVARLPSNPMIFVTRKNFPAANLKELLERLKANSGKIAAGTAGAGSGSHIASLLLQSLTGVQLSFVPYRGTGPALQDLVAGQIDLIIDQASNCLPQVRQGTIKAYAVTATERLASAPEIPTVAEAGLPSLLMEVWSGMWVPHGTPRPIVDRLNGAVVAALREPAVREKLAGVGLDGPPAGQEAPEALGAFQQAEVAKWWPIIKAANVTVE
jgi:tripartite-type tricarboxylate transporter receptor subunit TctC